MLRSIVAVTLFSAVMACPQHADSPEDHMKRSEVASDWVYDTSYNWGKISETYDLCQIGTQQSPIGLITATGLATGVHKPTFSYPRALKGQLYNWGYGPAFIPTSVNITSNPSMTYDGQTLYLKGWHIHAPSDHLIDQVRSKAEIHLVHASADGKEKAVVGIMLDALTHGSKVANSSFFDSVQLFKTPSVRDKSTMVPSKIDIKRLITEAGSVSKYWTYEGSLTSPPCRQGIRWFVAGSKVLLGADQMMDLLRVSAYSARSEQQVWEQNINV
ncbi:hypothetical protein DSL72_008767 [Monilinia vaccinii-corymbosi]|uniref:Alpha-carbonic anhydrase domain-containing protein n=1 Tax=Monilinia vaccinii-corymbosi TaxID=61207 RepID=A0A8A3PQC1_9HELO|nr:hypothetical protein DSL72_008767 [Monilinia vaccinii-corymbosi]